MSDHSESTSFRALFESAFQAYENKTGIPLAEHPIAMQLQSCHSVESMTALVQDQASTFNDFRGKDRVTKSVKTTLSILTKLSATASLATLLAWYVETDLMVCSTGTSDIFYSHFHLHMLYTLALLSYSLYGFTVISSRICDSHDIHVY
jgi:hypothetical protein